ncbi:uncharacterized protein M421DRAFT_420436 [Didymella exigua CBS 183.55]|uniref:Galactose oxidase n=1 Tax=Didymella exigua CBS 183.55 TaxID=1150837 RepID=A0A6A5RQG3_9PLEO|nr:uncharacterized protein M421DRAFT_420436 [Didymella exigua CBS 183.55]KAF1928546.1 hypothetical protein M421DRAFT_420436 [Didymella exigua CBS 183.55]
MTLSVTRLPWSALLHVPLLLSAAVAQMPYNPTRLLLNGDHVYVFQPSSQSSAQFQLGSIDVSRKIAARSLPYTILHSTLPFLDDKASRAFTPVLDDGGNLTVYTGDCSHGATGGEVWSFTLASGNKAGKWSQQDMSVASDKKDATTGANYLSNGISFSSIVGGDATNTGAYFFGGMCPNSGESSNDWQSAANYSNLMVTLSPSSTKDSAITYEMDVSSSRGPPIPEAGFTMTGLSPTYLNRSDGLQTQQRNFVLIGGHTSAAFINMSQIALFSLPEQGWTFIGVQQPDTLQTDLATRDVTTVDPRSGHTAVLSPDGEQIIVYGGWVGDTSSPAEPQLAILNIANGYGGTGKWEWVIPNATSGKGPASGSSLYGHGAVMLPGGVMMVTGGYSIVTSGTRRRRATTAVNSQAYFLNVTSNTWMTDYALPTTLSTSDPENAGPLSSSSQKAGLGAGIGIGLAAVCGLFAFYMWYTRRLKKQRGLREKQLQDLSFAAHRYNIDDYSPGFDGQGGHGDEVEHLADHNGSYYFPPGHQGGQGWKSAHGQDAERTGLLLEIPSPTRGLRRSLSGRPAYASGAVRGPGPIHPIDELEEEDDDEVEKINDRTPLTEQHATAERKVELSSSVLDNVPQLGPFFDEQCPSGAKKTTSRSASSSPVQDNTKEHEQLLTEWSGTGATANRRSNTVSTGCVSPDKVSSDERTNSNLSERSARSELSWTSSHGSLVRSASLRVTKLNTMMTTTQANPFRSPDSSPTHGRPRGYSESSRKTATDPQTQSISSMQSSGQQDNETFRTAHSSFTHLQAEGEALLGGNPEQMRPRTSSTSNGSNSHTFGDTETNHSRAMTATPATTYILDMSRPESRDARKSWLGSVRRVLRRSVSGADRTRSLTNTVSYHEPYTDKPGSPIEPSTFDNRKPFPINQPPRRAASDATFWKSRRGKQDWEEEVEGQWTRNSGDDWGAPEDIARAEKDRLRQEWRERCNLLVNLTSDDDLPTPRTPIAPNRLGVPSVEQRPCTPADEGDWDVEAAVERRVVQVMFTVPKSKLRVVNADPDGSSILSLPRESSREGDDFLRADKNGSPSRVKHLAGRFEQMSASKVSSPQMTPRASPVPSPSPSVRSMKIRTKRSSASLHKQSTGHDSLMRSLPEIKVKDKLVEE